MTPTPSQVSVWTGAARVIAKAKSAELNKRVSNGRNMVRNVSRFAYRAPTGVLLEALRINLCHDSNLGYSLCSGIMYASRNDMVKPDMAGSFLCDPLNVFLFLQNSQSSEVPVRI